MVNARTKWHNYERDVRKKYIEAWWEDCVTSRYASKLTDDKWVDLINTEPFLPQCKNYSKNFSIWQAIDLIRWIKKNFHDWIPVIHIKLTSKRKSVVVINEDDFFKLINKNNEHTTSK